jgi:hypothetical protein
VWAQDPNCKLPRDSLELKKLRSTLIIMRYRKVQVFLLELAEFTVSESLSLLYLKVNAILESGQDISCLAFRKEIH